MTTTRELTLTEFTTATRVPLTADERDLLREVHRGIQLQPTPRADGCYDLTPDQRIGVIALPGLTVRILPKVPMSSLLFLVQYACGVVSWMDGVPESASGDDFLDLLAISLARAVTRATGRGLVHGYRTEEAALHTPRGRLLFDEQIRRRWRMRPPVECRHDVFTPDVVDNQILLAAINGLLRLPLRSDHARDQLRRARSNFGGVTPRGFGAGRVPHVVLTRLNRHYGPALALARLALESSTLDMQRGSAHGSAFLVDMNEVFERFVRQALRSALGATEREFPDRPPDHHLDEHDVVLLRPDLTLLSNDRPIWIGDAKYKRLPAGGYRNADLYQVLAYCTRFGLASGTLIYAAAAGVGSVDHVVRVSGRTLRVRAIDLSSAPTQILKQLHELALEIQAAALSPPRSHTDETARKSG